MARVGIKDTLNECGTNKEFLEKFQMSSIFIEEAVKK